MRSLPPAARVALLVVVIGAAVIAVNLVLLGVGNETSDPVGRLTATTTAGARHEPVPLPAPPGDDEGEGESDGEDD